jgi:hypothetical protein
MDTNTARDRLKTYLDGILVQSARITTHLKTEVEPDKKTNTQNADIRFFVLATSNSLRWAIKLREIDTSIVSELDKFINSLPEAKDLRDMLEHEDAYLSGTGRKQSEFQKDVVVNDGELTIIGLMPQTVMTSNEGVNIGGRVNVELAAKAAKELINDLQL